MHKKKCKVFSDIILERVKMHRVGRVLDCAVRTEVSVCYQAAKLHLCQETQPNLQCVLLNLINLTSI